METPETQAQAATPAVAATNTVTPATIVPETGMTRLAFDNNYTDSRKIARTTFVDGVVTFAEDYVTQTNVPGVALTIQGVPYKLRVLQGSIKGASNAATLIGCTVKLTGVMRTHEGRQYFNPKDCEVIQASNLAKMAAAGISYSGAL